MNEKVFENYNAFYTMVQVAVGLANTLSDEADEDQGKAIELIGKAYGLGKPLIDEFKTIIIDDMAAIGTESDINAFYSLCEQNKIEPEKEALLRIKCDAIHSLQAANAKEPYGVQPEWFSYIRRVRYYPTIRYAQMSSAASSGIIICNRIAAIMAYLGLGTEKNAKGAIQRLRQCALWGDEPSVYLLAEIYEEKASLFKDLVKTLPYLEEGYTILPEEPSKDVCEMARKLFALIASVRQDIVYGHDRHRIDYSFAEVLMMDSLDYYKKLEYINEYEKGEWKDVTNPAKDPNKRIGFLPNPEDE